MNEATAEWIDDLIREELAPTAQGTNWSVYEKRKGKSDYKIPPPWVNRDAAHKPIPIDPSALEELIKERARHARRNPHDHERGFGQTWGERSYIVIFVDETHWRLHQRVQRPGEPPLPAKKRGAMFFNTRKGSTPNHSFFDAQDRDIPMEADGPYPARDCSTIILTNYLKGEAGKDLDDPKKPERYFFDLFFEVTSTDTSGSSMTVIIDPTGTNQGPPVDPDDRMTPLPPDPAA